MSVASIIIVGVGGRGCAALQHLQQHSLPDNISRIAISTDKRALNSVLCDNRVLLSETIANGRSSGGNAELAAAAVRDTEPALRQALCSADVIIMLTGLGGGNGSGVATELAKLAADMAIPVLVFATLPFNFEGQRRALLAQQSLLTMQQYGAAVVALPNDQLQRALGAATRLEQALDASNQFLLVILQQLTAMLADTGLINMDFNDFLSVIKQPGLALAGAIETEQEDDLPAALQKLLLNPLLQPQQLSQAKAALLHIVAGKGFSLQQFEALGLQLAAELPNVALLLQGLTLQPEADTKLKLLLLASGISADCRAKLLCV
ncbi:hypothetical protein [Rheinheimera maricola]|uniref:Cell division protein FtsZ n=1 Tax=Rheinheimera maricola TaxID=2793282 RepID=A0ABS7XEF5_9GAMM|nr:hypothetical protein [Rheinheimera maricola]MBZ9613514.1 hypothetical protein [Rheinheimera maricola]